MPKRKQHRYNFSERKALTKPIFFYILVRSWNSFEYFDKCIDSVLSQDYTQYKILFVDDCSDYTFEQKKYIRNKLKEHVAVFNRFQKFSVRNAYEMIHKYAEDLEGVVVNLDGDDYFSSATTLSYLAVMYSKFPISFTYGECFVKENIASAKLKVGRTKAFCNIEYPDAVKKCHQFRHHPFLPLHPRTWKVALFKQLKKTEFQINGITWLKYCEDMAIFFPFFENKSVSYKVIQKPLYVYNALNPYNDVKKGQIELISEELFIRKKNDAKLSFTEMTQTVCLHRNFLMSIPYVQSFLYSIQLALLKRGRLKDFFISLRPHPLKSKLLTHLADKKNLCVKVTTLDFGYQLNLLDNRLYLDLSKIPPKFTQQNQIYNLMWTLCFSQNISKRSHLNLKKMGVRHLEKIFI